jgi:hypothetical protein
MERNWYRMLLRLLLGMREGNIEVELIRNITGILMKVCWRAI